MQNMHNPGGKLQYSYTRPAVPDASRLKRGARAVRRGPWRMFHVKRGPCPGAMAPGFSLYARAVVAVL